MDETSLKPTSLLTSALLTIGVFASRSRLSQKALRLYDALGLLEPVFVDPSSNYRYYAPIQLERAKFIALLRVLEMPLNRIAAVLELSRPAAALELRRYGQELKADLGEKLSLVHYLEQSLESREIPMFKVLTRSVPERKIATIERRVLQNQLPQFIPTSTRALFVALGKAGLHDSGAPFVIYAGQMNNDSETAVEVCLPFEGHLEPSGKIRVRLEAAHGEAFIMMTRGAVDGPELMHGYDALFTWMRDQGKTELLGSREVYFNPDDWSDMAPDTPAFDIVTAY